MVDTLRLERIVVRRLFGTKNYDLEMERGAPTVLTGSNGSGKSTILGLIKAISSGDLATLAAAPLQSLELYFDVDEPFVLERHPAGRRFKISWGRHGSQSFDVLPEMEELPEWAESFTFDLSNLSTRAASAALRELSRENDIPFAEYRRVASIVTSVMEGREELEAPRWMTVLSLRFPVVFVTDQRLVVIEGRTPSNAQPNDKKASRSVERASSRIQRRMRFADSTYSDESKVQDRRFPRAVIDAITSGSAIEVQALTDLEIEVDKYRSRLHRVGLLLDDSDLEPLVPAGSLDNELVRPVIATFLRTTLAKLDVLSDLTAKLTSFKDFLDSQFAEKETILTKTDGVRFKVGNDQRLRPSDLSSGEQQMMMLAYEITFVAKSGTLVLIDEPELSLHVTWQSSLLENLSDMGQSVGITFLMATHSPTLLAEHQDSERPLDELVVSD